MNTKRAFAFAVLIPLAALGAYIALAAAPWHRRPAQHPLSPEDSARLWQESQALFSQGHYERALVDALDLHGAYPGNQLYIQMAADIYHRMHLYREEADYWEQFFDRAPNPLGACPQMGQAYWSLGQDEQAVNAFQRCLDRDPRNTDSIFFLAHALEGTGQSDRAGELYKQGLEIAPDYIDLQMGLARIELRQEKTEEAKKLALAALQKAPRNVDVLLVAGLVYAREGDLRQAKQYLQEGSGLFDGYLDFHYALARIAEQEKDIPEALHQYDRILQDAPGDRAVVARRAALIAKQ
ncbi:MAG: tetratricopeptide repeat protein [Acidobacteria bacterium]|nr:tetratricopeptide repeat protein [Acidobacteriota bacterium]